MQNERAAIVAFLRKLAQAKIQHAASLNNDPPLMSAARLRGQSTALDDAADMIEQGKHLDGAPVSEFKVDDPSGSRPRYMAP